MTTHDAFDSSALLRACRSRRLREREAAFRRLGELLYPIAWRRVKDDASLRHLAEDCTQEALVVVWRQLSAGKGPDRPESFVAWCATIVVNKLREEIRRLSPAATVQRSKRVPLRRLVSLDAPHPDDDDRTVAGAPAAPGADASLEQAELRDLVREIARMPEISERSRIVLIKGYVEGWDDADLAAHLDTTRANVHVIRCRDLAKLRAVPAFMDRLRRLWE